MSTVFADRLIDNVRRKNTPLCVGLDPFPENIPALFGDARQEIGAIERFCEAIIGIAAQHAGVFKPQVGLFEPFGPEGVRLAQEAVTEARAAGMVVILDAKRGDIGTTAEGYARASLGPAPGFDADCVTVNPYLGKDSLEPFLALAERDRKGVAVLVRTSNPGARDLQDLDVRGGPLWRRTAEMIAPESARLRGESGWSGLMAVAGATYPDEARALRQLLPEALFLVPGYGAQGASAADAVAGFLTKANGREGGVVNSSRGVTYPPAARAAKTLEDWRAAIGDAMAAAAAELRAACAV
ncbi:MAG TPA: orotidine-5'-phosphate decarboxylase [Candidatus Binatia bacterium]|nr:orotidine-5'-phosphate decarboxylase [Candidatus Binatia bacterium]